MRVPENVVAGLQVGWGAVFSLLTLLLGTGGVITAWVKLRPRMREIEQSAENMLRKDLIERVRKLEADAQTQAAMREAERARHEAEMTIMRHRVNNSDACLDALLMLLKTAPEKVAEAVEHIEKMRARQQQEVALERGAQAGAQVAAASIVPTGA